MRKNVTVGLIGDYSQTVPAHRAIPLALQRAADTLRIEVRFEWVATDEVTSIARVSRFDGLWCVPASPYRSMDGALRAIRHARAVISPLACALVEATGVVRLFPGTRIASAYGVSETTEGYQCRREGPPGRPATSSAARHSRSKFPPPDHSKAARRWQGFA
jgi:hypothetical protein